MADLKFKVDKLSTNNYSVWKTVIMSQLMGKDLWDVIVDQFEGDDDEIKIKNEQAKSLMYVAMDAQQIAATGVCPTARDLWVKIKENHEGSSSNLRSTALAEFLSIKYRKNESIISYAGRFENQLGKLESTDYKVDEKTKLWVFSNSLPQHMRLTVQMFTMATPNGRVKDLISQMKIQHHLDHHESDRNVAAYQAQERPQFSNKPRSSQASIECSYCKKLGHKWRECRKLKFDNQRKKKFGQANRQTLSGDRNNQANNYPQRRFDSNKSHNNNNHNQNTGAFSVKVHEFSERKYTWIVDSGASSHMTPYGDFLTDYEEFDQPRRIYLGDGKSLEAYGSGTMPFTSQEFTGELKKVLWVPKLSENLFSIGRAIENNCSVEFSNENSMVYFYRNKELVLSGIKKPDSVYFLLHMKPIKTKHTSEDSAMLGASLEEWHKRLGHCSIEAVKALIKSDAVTGLKISNSERPECRACILGKLCRAHHPTRAQIKASKDAAVLHLDTVGPMKTTSLGGGRYFVLATEEFSGYKLFETVSSKGLISDAVKRLVNQTELESSRPVKAIVTDNGTEFTNAELLKWTSKKGIIHTFSATYTPEQNGRAERANRTVLDGIRTLLADSKLPEELWGEALNTVVYTTNRVLSGTDKSKTRFELFTKRKPDIGNLKVFGQKAIIRENDSARASKLAPRGEEAVFVGYGDRYNTYRFYLNEPVPQIIITCDARFINPTHLETVDVSSESYKVVTDLVLEHEPDASSQEPATSTAGPNTDTSSNSDSDSNTDVDDENADTSAEHVTPREDESGTDSSNDGDTTIVERRVTRMQTNKLPPKKYSGASMVGVAECAMFTLDNEPRTTKDAQESEDWDKWKQAMDEEILALEKNKTWVLVDKPPNVKPIKNKWVYKAKLKPDGSIERFKARLVAKGYTQIANVDYKETYAPVASMNTIRMFLAIANQNLMHIVQFDVKTAFLYGDLEETLYMEQPDNYERVPDKVCKLVKSLYGLKQAPRQWNKKFDSFLKIFKLNQSEVDRCLYYSQDKSLLLAIYVDDGLAAGRDRKQLNKLITHLKDNFELKVMNCEAYLGFTITRNLEDRTLDICQAHYVEKILNRFGMADCKPVSTPEEVGLTFDDSPQLPEDNQFKELVGSLLYLTTCSRPDIAHAVSIASRTSQPTQAHWAALKRILRYLKGTRGLGIRFRWENASKLIGYSDADYANEVATRKSTTGYCIYFGGGPIAWRCQRQPIITLSTTEAEYVAGCELVKEILPIRQQLVELDQIDPKEPVQIYIDNQSAVRIATNEGGQNRTKHIDIREKWLTEQALNRKIEVKHISGDEQAADILTKPLYKSKFAANRSKLLTQVMAVLALIALCALETEGRTLRPTDPITPVKSDRVFVNGDTRYRITNIFMNPCDNLFNYTGSISNTGHLIRYCYDYFDKKHFRQLTNCQRQPTVGQDLREIPATYDCLEDLGPDSKGDRSHIGKCDITRRAPTSGPIPELELAHTQEAWNKHKNFVAQLPTLRRNKRFIPGLGWLLQIGLVGVFAGPAIKTYKLTNTNAENIDQLANITEIHSKILRDTTEFFEQYRNSVSTLHTWAEEIEERLGDDPMGSRLGADPIFRGRKASLVKTYMQWFDHQEKLLTEINRAAAMHKIPPSLKIMLNGTSNFDVAANLSTLFDCQYRLENKNMILDLEFNLPNIDENIEILEVLATDTYVIRNNTDEGGEEACWEDYIGPKFVFSNKTNGCTKALDISKTKSIAIRGQTCLEPINDLFQPAHHGLLWRREECIRDVPKIEKRIQIIEIDGVHKIYCYPYNIEFESEQIACPSGPFILEGHASYKIGNITHHGAYIDTTISRHIRSNRDVGGKLTRKKRSPAAMVITTSVPVTTTPALKQVGAETHHPPSRFRLSETMTNLTGQMNTTIRRIHETVKLLPSKLNLTRENFDMFFNAPFDLLSDGFSKLSEYAKSIGSVIGILTVVAALAIIMPALELFMLGLKVAKIPANMWLGSARRVTSKLKTVSSSTLENIPIMFKRKRKRWDDMV